VRGSLKSLLFLLAAAGCEPRGENASDPKAAGVIRVGHFPNITHAQALVARRKRWFEERLGVKVEWLSFNAGPSAMESIFADALDVTYTGPSPALNAYLRSGGEEIRVVAGSAIGGSALVVQGDGRIGAPADFRGKKVGTPQLGNTQDVACRAWLEKNGFHVTVTGGDVQVIPTANPDGLSLFRDGTLDAVWTVEPWVSRLEMEGGGKVLLEEKDALTTLLVASAAFLAAQPDLARRFVAAHNELTDWIRANEDEAKRLVGEELEAQTTRPVPKDLLDRSWKRLTFTKDVELAPLEDLVRQARDVGLLREAGDLSRLLASPR
jgi:NitT/TauT family transport system substrate-binding protein